MTDLTGALRAALGHIAAARVAATPGSEQLDHLDHAATDIVHAIGIAETEGQHVAWARYQEALAVAHRQQAEHAASLERQFRNVNASHVTEATS